MHINFFDLADIYGKYVNDESIASNIIKIIEEICRAVKLIFNEAASVCKSCILQKHF